MKKIVSLFLSLLTLFSMFAPMALASESNPEQPITPYYERASDVQASLSKSGASAKCAGFIRSMSATDKISLTMTLRKKSGGSWLYVDSWSDSGTYSVSLSKTTGGLSSGTYKLLVSGTVSGGGISEPVSKESGEITI